ncbi:MAG: hypothetical protein AB7K68_00610 [Bacteriovoracia bacterium]
MKYLFALFLLSACATAAPKSSVHSATEKKEEDAPALSHRGGSPLKEFTFSKENAEKLYGALKEIGVRPIRDGSVTYLTAHDLSCTLVPTQNDAATECEYWDGAPGAKSRKQHLVKNKKGLENLRLFLSEYPVEQGDTGAVVRFAQCRVYRESLDCFLAIHMNYEGP